MGKPYRQLFHTLEQHVSATDQFDGTLPASAIDDAAEALKPYSRVWEEDAAGGLFDWNHEDVNPGRAGAGNNSYVRVKQLVIFSGAAFDWTLSMTDGTFSSPWQSGLADTDVYSTTELLLPPGWYLELVTVGGTAAITAMITAVPEEIGR